MNSHDYNLKNNWALILIKTINLFEVLFLLKLYDIWFILYCNSICLSARFMKIILRVMLLLLKISYERIEIWKMSNSSWKTCMNKIYKFVLEILARPERVMKPYENEFNDFETTYKFFISQFSLISYLWFWKKNFVFYFHLKIWIAENYYTTLYLKLLNVAK